MSANSERKALRTQLRAKRSSLPADKAASYSRAIANRAYPLVKHARLLGGYYALELEVRLESLLRRCRANQQKTYLPLVKQGNVIKFAPFDEHTTLIKNRYGIKEPQVSSSNYLPPPKLDAVIVPLVGFDSQCNRLGMGGGYYDRSFAHRLNNPGKPLLVGVAYELQAVESVLSQCWDVPLDFVVTESRVLERRL